MGTCVHFSRSLPSNSWWQTRAGWQHKAQPGVSKPGRSTLERTEGRLRAVARLLHGARPGKERCPSRSARYGPPAPTLRSRTSGVVETCRSGRSMASRGPTDSWPGAFKARGRLGGGSARRGAPPLAAVDARDGMLRPGSDGARGRTHAHDDGSGGRRGLPDPG